jgi:two-component system chemotaxis response regulator CheB
MTLAQPFRIMICDDQATVRRLLALLLSSVPGAEVTAEAEDAETAWAALARRPVDLVLLDLELPGRHGFALLERIMRECPVPVLIVSGAGGAGRELKDKARQLGAIGFVEKPDGVSTTHETLRRALAYHVGALAAARAATAENPAPIAPAPLTAQGTGQAPLIAIGSSTGGIIAVIETLKAMPARIGPILIAQHMLPGYAEGFAARLASATPHAVRVARGGEKLEPGTVLVAPSARHLAARREGGRLLASLDDQGKVSGHKPSCDVLFGSVAEAAGAGAIGLILTGMGRDGADGLLAMRRAGARTLAQDEATSVVFGMPRAALENGGAERALPLRGLGAEIAALAAGFSAARPPARSIRHLSQMEPRP